MNKPIMPYSAAKALLLQLKPFVTEKPYNHETIQAIYNQFDWLQWHNEVAFSPLYNKFTAHLQMWKFNLIKVGEKEGLYFDSRARKVGTWTGKKLGIITSLAFYKSGGFAPCKRVSITFTYRKMVFRGICSYANMDCFTAKRIK